MDSLMAHLKADFNAFQLATGLAGLVILYPISLVIYRLTFDQLAKFPGPKIAAVTFWYEFYYDWWYEGHYVFEIEKMHMKYGLFLLSLLRCRMLTDPRRSHCAGQSQRIIDSRSGCLQRDLCHGE